MENGGNRIDSITLYACGYCENKLHRVLRGGRHKKLRFPALVVKLRHKKYGTILFDTGYSYRIYENGVVSTLYNMLNPTHVTMQDSIAYKLRNEDEEVKHIILSHPHPDHIGGLRDFDGYCLHLSKKCYKKLEHSKLFDLVFENQLPETMDYHLLRPYRGKHFLKYYFNEIYDIFGDGSIFGVALEGHSYGQVGIYIPQYQVLFAADASWGRYFAERVTRMRILPRMIQDNFSQYQDSIRRLERFQKKHPEIRVIYSHEPVKEGMYEP